MQQQQQQKSKSITGDICRACASAGYGNVAGTMAWCENWLQGIGPVKLFRTKGGTWGSGTGLKTMSRCSCMRMGVESAQDQYQNLGNCP